MTNNSPVSESSGQINTTQVQGRSESTESHESREYGMTKTKSQNANPSPRNPTCTPTAEKSAKQREPSPTRSTLEPPVTKNTLSELDVNKIVNNPKLRSDISFDPDLHFRPNLDGEKGRRKTQKATHFWDTMKAQLQDFLMNREQFEKELDGTDWCLPVTLKAIRGILETLVPQRDRASVEETFNVDLLMQQFRKGVADLGKLAQWLSKLLKCHCAPMRDIWVDEMVELLTAGDRNFDVNLLVLGMQSLLGVLEAMKLDVANHQIRCLRPLLIEDSVSFQQKFFMKKIAMGRVDVVGAHNWYRRAASLPRIVQISVHSQGDTWDFMRGLVNLVLPSKSSEPIPHTFLFDEERLAKIRADIMDAINLEVCMIMYQDLKMRYRPEVRYSVHEDTPSLSFVPSPAENGVLSSPTIPSEQDFNRTWKAFDQEKGHFTRTASGRQSWAPAIEEETVTSSHSSPRSSPSSLSSTPETFPTMPLYLSLRQSESVSQVQHSVLAILTSTTSSDRWGSLSASIALQILRSTPAPLSYLPVFEQNLARHLSNPNSPIYEEAEVRILSQLYPVLQKFVETYSALTSLQIFDAVTKPRVVPGISESSSSTTTKKEMSEIATRIAHIGVLHWRVWAPLVYLVDPSASTECEMRDV
ncbi:hypothetical protein B7494_g264 [Chlorociboria aeruginascens]|nr:hypothetical protein B7494_g264 [Chlorociboria aeruginascens]